VATIDGGGKGDTLREEAVRYFQGRMKPFTQADVCDLLGVSRFALLRWRRDGKLRCFKCGGIVRYHVEDVYALLCQQTV